jgi:hypothetical protein
MCVCVFVRVCSQEVIELVRKKKLSFVCVCVCFVCVFDTEKHNLEKR